MAKRVEHEGTIEICAHRVSYSYWSSPVEITDEVASLLEEEAESRSKALITEGYRAGELNCLVNDHEVRGWWEIES